jgi:thymidylate kinase
MRIFSIEGNIGSGKSTFLKRLELYYAKNNNFIFLQEPVDNWNEIVDSNGVNILTKYLVLP